MPAVLVLRLSEHIGRPGGGDAARVPLGIAVHEVSREQRLEADGEELVVRQLWMRGKKPNGTTKQVRIFRLKIACLVLGLARNVLPGGEDDGLVGQRLPRDGAQRDKAVVVAAYWAVGAVATVPAAAAVAIVATDLAAGFAVSAESRPVICDS